jgi:hypothetical protein
MAGTSSGFAGIFIVKAVAFQVVERVQIEVRVLLHNGLILAFPALLHRKQFFDDGV